MTVYCFVYTVYRYREVVFIIYRAGIYLLGSILFTGLVCGTSFADGVVVDDPVDRMVMVAPRKPDSIDGRLLILFYSEAFRRLGKELDYRYMAFKRSTAAVKRGEVDGELARSGHYHKIVPELIMVKEPATKIKITAFTTDPEIRLSGWEALKKTKYRTQYVYGDYHFSEHAHSFSGHEKLFYVYNWENGLENLVAGRVKVFVHVERTILAALKDRKYKGTHVYSAGVVEELYLHAFFNKKHREFAEKLSVVIEDLKNEGLLETFDRAVRNP